LKKKTFELKKARFSDAIFDIGNEFSVFRGVEGIRLKIAVKRF